MAIMEISVIPLGTQTPSVSKYVANAIKILKKEKNIKYELTSMGTIVECNSIDKLFDIAKKIHHVPFNSEIKRVVTSLKIDDRKDKELTIKGKKKSVYKKANSKK